MSFRLSRVALLASAIFCMPACLSASSAALAEDVLGPKVGKSLQAAQTALSGHNYDKAMAAVNEADAVSGKTDYETYTINQMRAAVAAQSGDVAAASAAYDKLIASPRTPKAAKAQMLMAEATMAYTAKDYPHAVTGIERYLKEAGPNQQMETLLVQAYYLQNDFKNAARVQQVMIDEALKAKKTPAESQLQLLATCQAQLKDMAGMTHTYVLLATYYPKPEYWAQLLHGLVTNPKIPPALQLDVYRIRLAAGNLTAAADFMDASEIAMQMGMPQVALDILNAGYAQGALGKDAGAPRQAKLKALVVKTIEDKKASIAADEAAAAKAPSGNALITVGYNYVTFGQVDKGLDLIKQGIAKGPFDVNVAKLRLGEAQMTAGQNADAIATFDTVEGDNGAKDIAQLWSLKLKSAAKK